MEADVSLLIGAAKDGKLQHAHFFNGGMLHGELLLLTAYAIAEVCGPKLAGLERLQSIFCHHKLTWSQIEPWLRPPCSFAGAFSQVCCCWQPVCPDPRRLLRWQRCWSSSTADPCWPAECFQYTHLRQLLSCIHRYVVSLELVLNQLSVIAHHSVSAKQASSSTNCCRRAVDILTLLLSWL